MEKDPSQPHRITSISAITDKLYKDGYTEEFVLVEEGLKSTTTKEIFQTGDIKINKHYRYEGTTDPADMSIIYAIETNTGLKGCIVAGYGPNSDTSYTEFFKYVEELPNSNNPNGYKYQEGENASYK